MVSLNEYFPFETYIFSCDENEYLRDIRKRNRILRYVDLLYVDQMDYESLQRLASLLVFFRSIFIKTEILRFYLDVIEKEKKEIVSYVFFDMLIKSNQGEIGELEEYCKYAHQLRKSICYENPLNDNWNTLKEDMKGIV